MLFLYNYDYWLLEIVDKYKENVKYESKNILCKIFYVVSVRMSGEILENRKFGWYRPDEIQGQFFCLFIRKNPIKVINC